MVDCADWRVAGDSHALLHMNLPHDPGLFVVDLHSKDKLRCRNVTEDVVALQSVTGLFVPGLDEGVHVGGGRFVAVDLGHLDDDRHREEGGRIAIVPSGGG